MKFKRTLLIVSITFVLFLSFFIIDYVRTVNNQSPVFSIPMLRVKDGGSIEYFGLGYKVIKYVLILEDGTKVETYKIGTWLMPFDNPLKASQNVSENNTTASTLLITKIRHGDPVTIKYTPILNIYRDIEKYWTNSDDGDDTNLQSAVDNLAKVVNVSSSTDSELGYHLWCSFVETRENIMYAIHDLNNDGIAFEVL